MDSEQVDSRKLDHEEYERIVREAIESNDPDPERKRKVELVRRGLEGEFWTWLKQAVNEEARLDMERLADPRTTQEMVGFLRGKIHAKNEILRLPYTYVQLYDFEQSEAEESEDIPQGRPLSPYQEEFDDE